MEPPSGQTHSQQHIAVPFILRLLILILLFTFVIFTMLKKYTSNSVDVIDYVISVMLCQNLFIFPRVDNFTKIHYLIYKNSGVTIIIAVELLKVQQYN